MNAKHSKLIKGLTGDLSQGFHDARADSTGLKSLSWGSRGRFRFKGGALGGIGDGPPALPEISFTRHFYKPSPVRSLEEIRGDILAVEKETEGLLGEIIGVGDG